MTLAEYLKEHQITLYRLSKNTGISIATIHDICSGKAKLEDCSVKRILMIASALGMTVEDFITSFTGFTFELDPKYMVSTKTE